MKLTSEEPVQNSDDRSILEWLFSGNATAKLLDFFVTYTDNDYSETDIAGLAGISLRTAFREIPKFESLGLIAFTRKVGRAKMYKLNRNCDAAKHLQQFAFDIATKRIDNTMKAIESRQEKLIVDAREEDVLTSKQDA